MDVDHTDMDFSFLHGIGKYPKKKHQFPYENNWKSVLNRPMSFSFKKDGICE